MAGRPNRRRKRDHIPTPQYPELVAIYAEEWDSFDAMRAAMIRKGIIEHGISPYDAIQRAIDDVTTDYLLLQRHIRKEAENSKKFNKHQAYVEHPLYDHMLHLRECSVRYSTFAAQYQMEQRRAKLSETRIAVLANTLRTVLENMQLPQDTIRQIPRLLIEELDKDRHAMQISAQKAEALAEILHNDSDVEFIDVDVEEIDDEEPAA